MVLSDSSRDIGAGHSSLVNHSIRNDLHSAAQPCVQADRREVRSLDLSFAAGGRLTRRCTPVRASS